MINKKFEDDLLQLKKNKFIEIILKASKELGFKNPPRINFDECPDAKDEIAHIHLENWMICISPWRLKQMTFEEIEETATHEISHILRLGHDEIFQDIHSKVRQNIWRPPGGGIITINEQKSNKKSKKERKTRIDKTRCNYHLCRKKKRLEKCKYCSNFFCQDHIQPIEPSLPNYSKPNIKHRIAMEEKEGHPCMDYVDYLRKKEERINEEYDKYLKKEKSNNFKFYILNFFSIACFI